MKLRWYDRVLVSLGGLMLAGLGILVMLAAGGVVGVFGLPDWLALDRWMGDGWQWMPLIFIAGLLLTVWGVYLFLRPLRAYGGAQDRYFSMGDAENGEMTISVQALDHLVHKCVDARPEILSAQVQIAGREDSIEVTLRMVLRADVRIPRLVEQVQAQVRQHLQDCAGVRVESVRIIVESTRDPNARASRASVKLASVEPQPLPQPDPAEKDVRNDSLRPPVSAETPARQEEAPEPLRQEEAPEPLRQEEAPAFAAAQGADMDFGPREPLPVSLSEEAFPFPASDAPDEAPARAEAEAAAEEASPAMEQEEAGHA
ncbi:MAG TPA: alkaline shock response membrane anchor protein AmaP [Candidatus Avichristensenella intestinipullorum]|uniref:Alkaline shock response membrane anchor protein AmaP n=1 Tax=Candidatus Avichristensenella intestinipullorum TaxID=2840693 RepID=A0A9D1CIT7_9FIRM|nr:alkaline shock response membrane anchor protein AmaP [Candidatus Avichristensenella intestinipullorum]